jgi:hypothetical protein
VKERPHAREHAPPREAAWRLYTMVFANQIINEQMIQIRAPQGLAALWLATIFKKMEEKSRFLQVEGGKSRN